MINIDNEIYCVGDLVFKTPFYTNNYPMWKITSGVLMSYSIRFILDTSISAVDKPMYHTRYGICDKYPIITMIITTSSGNYLVNQFGFNKDNT